MSVDSDAGTAPTGPTGTTCALCGGSFDHGDELVVQCYPEEGRDHPDPAATDGFLGVCTDCADEVDELLAAWNTHEEPPVGPDASIAAGYRHVADDCSFCDRALDEEPLLGVEYVRGVDGSNDDREDDGPEPESYANYSLCGDCVPVFDEFLQGVGGDGSA